MDRASDALLASAPVPVELPARKPLLTRTGWTAVLVALVMVCAVAHLLNLVVPAGASVGTTYTLYALANAGIGGDQVGWNHATNHTVTVAAAPVAFTVCT